MAAQTLFAKKRGEGERRQERPKLAPVVIVFCLFVGLRQRERGGKRGVSRQMTSRECQGGGRLEVANGRPSWDRGGDEKASGHRKIDRLIVGRVGAWSVAHTGKKKMCSRSRGDVAFGQHPIYCNRGGGVVCFLRPYCAKQRFKSVKAGGV